MIDLSKTIDLSTTYLGLKLKNPLVVSPSPMCEDVGNIRRMEDSGAAAVVLHSLFEEQIEIESHELDRFIDRRLEMSAPNPITHFPELMQPVRGREGYLKHIEKCQAGGRDSRHREPERHHQGRLARIRQRDGAGRRGRAGAEHLLHSHRRQRHRRPGGAHLHRPGGGRQGRGAHSRGRQAGPVFQLAWPTWPRSWTPRARTVWCSSTASTSPTTIWKRWRWCPT